MNCMEEVKRVEVKRFDLLMVSIVLRRAVESVSVLFKEIGTRTSRFPATNEPLREKQ